MGSKVQTVFGDVSPDKLGITLTCEHLSSNFSHFYRKPPSYITRQFTGIQLDNISYIKQYPYSSLDNLILNDDISSKAVKSDMQRYKINGGDMQHLDHLHACKEELYNLMLKDMTEANTKSGCLGGIASVWPIKDFERRAIEAVGELQVQLGCGVSFHPYGDPAAILEIMRLYGEAGGRLNKAVMSHLDRTPINVEILDELAEMGCYCQFSNFGAEMTYYNLGVTTNMPTDAQRLELIRHLVEDGKSDRILMSHGIHTKHRLSTFGGHGCSHILHNIVPRMKDIGLSQQQIDEITITNPANWLSMPA